MEGLHVWIGDLGMIDIKQFSHLKFRKDGWFDGRRNESYYKDLKDYIKQKEIEMANEQSSLDSEN